MISKILQNSRMLIVGVVLAFVAYGLSAVPAHVNAADTANQAVCEGLGAAFDGEGCTDPDGSSSLDGTINNVVDVLSIVVAVIAVFMIVVGGLRFATSGGDSNSVSGARKQIIYAIVGLVIVALAQIIVQFTVAKTGDSPQSSGEVINPEVCAPGQPC